MPTVPNVNIVAKIINYFRKTIITTVITADTHSLRYVQTTLYVPSSLINIAFFVAICNGKDTVTMGTEVRLKWSKRVSSWLAV